MNSPGAPPDEAPLAPLENVPLAPRCTMGVGGPARFFVEAADEATVKTFFREKGRVRLQPENSSMEPLYPEHVSILGKVVGVFRRVG